MKAEIPNINTPLNPNNRPPTIAILDLLEFCYNSIGNPIEREDHSFLRHKHIGFNEERGRQIFSDKINLYFLRNGLAYKLNEKGKIERLASPTLYPILKSSTFSTGDSDLDELLEDSKNKFLSPDPKIRKESLEKLWDAWERLKTIEPGKGKKESVTKLLDNVTDIEFLRQIIEKEATYLTEIGNKCRIRHSETDKIPISEDEIVDYLFHRMFSLIWLILNKTKRIKK